MPANSIITFHDSQRPEEACCPVLTIAETIQPHLPALPDNFSQDCMALKNIQPETKLSISQIRAVNEDRALLLLAASRLFKEQLNGKIEQYVDSHTGFYLAYLSARNIIKRSKGIKAEKPPKSR